MKLKLGLVREGINFMKKAVIIALAVCLVIALSCFGGYLLNDQFNRPDPLEEDTRNDNVYKPGSVDTEADISEILVKGVLKECRLITTEIYLNCDITIDESYYELDIFKKRQKLTFYASALFSVDLEGFTADDIFFAENKKTAYIYIEKPQLAFITVDNDKTVINKTEKGLLRFGEIKITPESYNEIESEAIKKMTEQINNEEVKILSEYNAGIAIKDLFLNILSVTEYSDYDIIVEYK